MGDFLLPFLSVVIWTEMAVVTLVGLIPDEFCFIQLSC